MWYLFVFMLSLLSTYVGLVGASAHKTLALAKAGGQGDGSVSIFPVFPTVTLTYLAATWAINLLDTNMGFHVVITYGCLSIVARLLIVATTMARLKKVRRANGKVDALR